MKPDKYRQCMYCPFPATAFVLFWGNSSVTPTIALPLCEYHRYDQMSPEDREITFEEFVIHEVMDS